MLLLALCGFAWSGDDQRRDQLVWDYAQFLDAFTAKDWPRVKPFVTAETKVGLGGDMGMHSVVRVFGDSGECHGAMTDALRLGCKAMGHGAGMRCVSPPHLGPDVIYLGARASFAFNADNDIWVLEFLICGGD